MDNSPKTVNSTNTSSDAPSNSQAVPAPASTSSYVPGVCNINTAEIAYRRKSAYVLLAVTLVMAVPFFLLDIPAWARLLLFFPLFLTIVCYLQVKYKFCVSYGAAGKQNAAEGDKVAQDIIDAASLKLDKARTQKIKLQAAAAAALITALLVLIP